MKKQNGNNKIWNEVLILRLILTIIGFGIVLVACEQKVERKKNKKLIGFKSEWIGELGDDNYISVEPLAESKKTEVKQIDDILIVKSWQFTNTCGNYEENISISSDTITLELNLISDEVCTSMSIKKLTYLIDNPEKKKWIIK